MRKTVSFVLLFVYIFPLLFVLPSFFNIYTVITVITLITLFCLSITIPLASQSERYFSTRVFILLFLLYLTLKWEVILIYVEDLLNGTFFMGFQERAIRRYSSDTGLSLAMKASRVVLYSLAPCLIAVRLNRINKGLIFILILVLESFDLARAPMLLFTVLILVDYIIQYGFKVDRIPWRAFLLVCLKVGVSAFVFFVIVALGRIQGEDGVLQILFKKIGEYTISMYWTFLYWLRSGSWSALNLDIESFFAIKKFITGEVAKDGFYQNHVVTPYGRTIVYTNIRGIVEDLGILSVVVVPLIFSNLLFRYKLKLKIFQRIILVMLCYPIISPFIYTVFLLGFILGWIIYVYTSKEYC